MAYSEEKLICWDLIYYHYLRIRQRFRRHFKRRAAFFFSLLITYLLTIGLTIGAIAIQVDGIYVPQSAQTSSENLSADPNSTTPPQADTSATGNDTTTGNFVFYACTGLSTSMFVAAKLLETLVPTAITFSGTILILQTDSSTKRSLTVWLFVVITLLVVGGIVLPTAKTLVFLETYLWTLGALCLASVILSWQAFSDPSEESKIHKNESSDGKMVY